MVMVEVGRFMSQDAGYAPGLAAWEWWKTGDLGGVSLEPGINTLTYKHYIDFCGSKTEPHTQTVMVETRP